MDAPVMAIAFAFFFSALRHESHRRSPARTVAAGLVGACAEPRGQRGVSLIEVMVSLFIVSMGILALAGLLSMAARVGKASELRASATLLANDLADRIRANPGAMLAVPSGYEWTPMVSRSVPFAPPQPHKIDCSVNAPCTPEEIAALDLYDWHRRLQHSLPGGFGMVTSIAADSGGRHGALVNIWVAWTDMGAALNGGAPARAALECPDVFRKSAVRCLYLRVAL